MKQDGTFELSQPELDARNPQEYYNNYPLSDLNKGDTDIDLSDSEFVVETEVDPYDEVFSGTGNGLSQYSNVYDSQSDSLSYYNVVRF